ncbi:gene transfer agent family protein [Pseudoponticoccus marisrubri]|uniref:Gene transfer agent family protein n=1 Tax=Pseudoponticoccus marisrubri TaxID=1685382 RepID=A0A0W7WPB1_9RHOB|nr:gene transfer agent family protein [Pseudoponticoccus marisrubri]KUF12411.1 hypothetical protein AVJ23_01385 [Pseudoponticoccus marisrubri]
MKHTAFFGDGEKTFALTDDMIGELERVTETGIGALYLRVVRAGFALADLTQIIRLGLIGGGTAPETAHNLCTTYATNRPLEELYPLALNILDARWSGTTKEPADG